MEFLFEFFLFIIIVGYGVAILIIIIRISTDIEIIDVSVIPVSKLYIRGLSKFIDSAPYDDVALRIPNPFCLIVESISLEGATLATDAVKIAQAKGLRIILIPSVLVFFQQFVAVPFGVSLGTCYRINFGYGFVVITPISFRIDVGGLAIQINILNGFDAMLRSFNITVHTFVPSVKMADGMEIHVIVGIGDETVLLVVLFNVNVFMFVVPDRVGFGMVYAPEIKYCISSVGCVVASCHDFLSLGIIIYVYAIA